MSAAASAPLVVTAELDEGADAWFEDLRRAHYPPARNVVPAHLTLFHSLPAKEEHAVARALRAACRQRAPMRVEVRGPWSLGVGVAYRVSSPRLEALRAELAAVFGPWLRGLDLAPWRPHITIQNKADPEAARRLLGQLELEFQPFDVEAVGLLVWRWRGGPWEMIGRVPFGEERS
jgi:2'-5' RNA ligase